MDNNKRTIAIVCGGDSSEHDVSLRSGQGLYSFFDKERYNIYIVDVKGIDWHVAFDDGTTAEIDKNDFSFVKDGKREFFDYAYITIHGQPGENGVMQGYFDLIHMPYSTSGVLVEAMTFDKYVLNNYLRGFGVKVADSILLRRGEAYDEEAIAKRIGMPCSRWQQLRRVQGKGERSVGSCSSSGVHGVRRGYGRSLYAGCGNLAGHLQDQG